MSTRMAPRMIQVTFRYPDGSVRLAAPADVPLGELMPDFLDLAEQPDGDGWVLGADGVHAYPGERTLAELGLVDGGVLVLHRAPRQAGHHGRGRAVFTRSTAARTTDRRRGAAAARADRPHATAEALAARALPARPPRPGRRSGAPRGSRARRLERSRPANVHPPRAPLPHRPGTRGVAQHRLSTPTR